MRDAMLAILALLATGTAATAGSVPRYSYDYPGASWAGSSGLPATARIGPWPNARRRHPGDGTCIAVKTRTSCSRGSRRCRSSSKVCSSRVGGATGIIRIGRQAFSVSVVSAAAHLSLN